MAKHFLHTEIPNAAVGEALFHVIPVPMERSVSFGAGTARAPRIILEASGQLELFDVTMGQIGSFGIHTTPKVDIHGDLEGIFDRISDRTSEALEAGAKPVVIGGEHTVTYGAIRGLKKHHEEIGVVNFDAHSDLRDIYEGDRFSHACVMRRIFEEGTPVAEVGIRAMCMDEMHFITQNRIPFFPAKEIVGEDKGNLTLPNNFPKKIYLSVDVDGLDPGVTPATGTPIPGGFGYYRLLSLIEDLSRKHEILGFDLVEHAPIENMHAYDYLCADLIYKIMALIIKSDSPPNN